jgi:tryptophan-rich sensory protein
VASAAKTLIIFDRQEVLLLFLLNPCILIYIFYKEFYMAKATQIDKLGWLVNVILTIFFDPIVQGINRILRGKVIIGLLWIITVGIFGIGWIIDIITIIFKKKITFLA